MIWTIICLIIYLVCAQIPVYGISPQQGADPLYWIRTIIASNRGTVMELGISPIITASMVLQLLSGAKVISVDHTSADDRKLFQGAEKLLGILITIGEAIGFVISGMYGDLTDIGAFFAVVIILQMVTAGILVILLDELMKNGYGLGSGISLFIATNICETIMWKSFSPMIYSVGETKSEFEGAFIALFHFLIVKTNKLKALQEAFYRSTGANLASVIATVIIFAVVIYFQGFRVDVTLRNPKAKGMDQYYPIKLFYTSNMPIILLTALTSNFYFLSQMIYKRFRGNLIVDILGKWQEVSMGRQPVPVGGIVYYISPPGDLIEFIRNPLHSLIYVVFVLGACTLFSKTWIEISGQSPKEVAKSIKEQNLCLVGGKRDSANPKLLDKLIQPAASLGGLCIGLLTIIADLIGVIGSGSGILLAVTIIYQFYETINKEKVKDL